MKRAAFLLALSLVAAPFGAAAQPKPAPPAAVNKPAASAPLASPVERRLFSDTVEASSFLWNDWNRFQENYHPNYVGDDDPATGWVEGVESSGAGQWLRLAVTPLDGTSRVKLKIRNGYQKSAALFKANARAKEITVKLLPSGKTVKATLADKQGWQEVAVDQPVAQLRAVELSIGSVYEGSKYADLVISDVQVLATSTTKDNPTFEKSKRQSLLDWRKARMAAAKLFKAGKGDSLPLYSSYRVSEHPLARHVIEARNKGGLLDSATADPAFAEWRDAIKLAQAVSEDGYAAMTRAQISPIDGTALPEVDGFEQLELSESFEGLLQDHALRLPAVGSVSGFFAEKMRVLDQKGATYNDYLTGVYSREKCKPAAWVKRAKAVEGGPDRVAALLVTDCGQVESREGMATAVASQLLIYGKDGRLALVVGDGYVDGYSWEAGGKVAGGRSMQYDLSIEVKKAQLAAAK
jgi:hypothetical protein